MQFAVLDLPSAVLPFPLREMQLQFSAVSVVLCELCAKRGAVPEFFIPFRSAHHPGIQEALANDATGLVLMDAQQTIDPAHMKKLHNKVAIVSGSGRGIGRAVALKLASEGARVVINDLDEAPALETLEAIKAIGGEAALCIGSVTATDFGDRFVATALDTFGGLDIIVNNAGFTRDAVIQNMTDEQFESIMDVHVTAPFRILRAAAEPLRRFAKAEAAAGVEHFRKVVNISSVSGLGGNPGQVNYAAAKMAVVGMTNTLAKEWGRYKVNVNCVAFGFIRTRMTQPLTTETDASGATRKVGVQPALIEQLEQQAIPLGRLGTPEEAADGVYLFCSPESNYISGQTIVVGGGITF